MSAAERLSVLSRSEVAEYTRSHTRAGQRKMLVANGIRHSLDNYGWPVVLRSSVEGGTTPKAAPVWTPRKAANGP